MPARRAFYRPARRAFPAALLLAVSLFLGACSSTAPPPAADGPFRFEVQPDLVYRSEGLRVATFNTEFMFDGLDDEGGATFDWKGDPAKARAHRDRIAAVVRRLDADVLILPEVEHLAVLQMLIDESLSDLGYTAHLVDGQDSFTGQDVGLLSRVPVDTTGRSDERVPVGATDQLYGVSKNLWARLTLGDLPVTLIGVHFLAIPDDVERKPRREAQAEVIRRLVEREQALGRHPIVLGDFNDYDPDVQDVRGSTPISNVLATIKRAGPLPTDDLVNVLGEVPQRERFTALYDRNSDGVIIQDDLSAIDHILLDPALYATLREVRFVHIHDPRESPDHFPVVVVLGLKR